MALSLDLAACEAKIARAAVHLESLKRECKIAFDQRQPYSLRMYQIEPNSPWYGISYKAADFKEFGLGVIVGDIVHNMRSALDYIVSTLVEASGHKVGNKHQFPIFSDRNEYIKRVGTATRALAKSPIRGVRFGLQEIWQVQPFHKNPEPELDPLAVIHRFSNADSIE